MLRSLKEDLLERTKCCAVLEKSRAKDVNQEFYLGSDSGFMTPVHSKIGQEMRMHIERLASRHGRKQLVLVYIEDNIFNFVMSKEVKFIETNVNEYGKAVRS